MAGRVTLNGVPRDQLSNPVGVAYVPQSDFLLPSLTVRETLEFSCKLRLAKGTPPGVVQVLRTVPDKEAPTARRDLTQAVHEGGFSAE